MKLPSKASARQYWLLGFGYFVFFSPACCLPVSFPFMSAGREGRGWEMLQDPSRLLEEPSGSHDRWSLTVLSEIPGTWCLGPRGREAVTLGAAVLTRGPFNVL